MLSELRDKSFNDCSVDDTIDLGARIGHLIKLSLQDRNIGVKIGFTGDLGAGKTQMIKSIVSELIPDIVVTSPTYTIINEYVSEDFRIYHVDLYRIESPEELLGTGFYEIFDDQSSIMLIEWFDRFIDTRFDDNNIIIVDISYLSEDLRKISIR